MAALTRLASQKTIRSLNPPIRARWLILRWNPQTYSFVRRAPGELLPIDLGRRSRRLPRVDSLLQKKYEYDPKPRNFMLLARENPQEAEQWLLDLASEEDTNTLEEYATALAVVMGRVPKLPDCINDRRAAISAAVMSSYTTHDQSNVLVTDSKTPLDILAEPIPGLPAENYSEYFNTLTDPQKRARFEKIYHDFNKTRQCRLDSYNTLPQPVQLLRESWISSIKYIPAGYDALKKVKPVVSEVVASELARLVVSMTAATFPQPVSSICRRLGAALEALVLQDAAAEVGIPTWHRGSRFLWGLIGGPRWSAKDRIILGSLYLEQALNKCRFNQKHPHTGDMVLRPAFWRTWYMDGASKRGIIKLNSALLNQIKLSVDIGVGPEQLPMVVPPRKWVSMSDGGYVAISPRRLALMPPANRSPEQEATVASAIADGLMDEALEAVNRLGRCAWRINSTVLHVIEHFLDNGVSLSDLPHKDSQEDITKKDRSITWVQYRQALSIAQALSRHGHRFYVPVYMDFRGRCYTAASSRLSHMGSDSLRALHQFWYGRPLGSTGFRALLLHLANVWGAKRGSTPELKAQWALDHMDQVLEVASNPTRSEWWRQAAKPFQTLAACAEIAAAVKHGDPANFISHLPVSIDGTCNGLQHLVALARDGDAAKHVNLVPQDIPGDVYETVATAVTRMLGTEITREVTKDPVMMSFYGATRYTQTEAVRARTHMSQDQASEVVEAIGMVLECVFCRERAVQEWLTDQAGRITNSVDVDSAVANEGSGSSGYSTGCAVTWTQPLLGTPVVQPYAMPKPLVVRSPLQAFYLPSPFHPADVDRYKQRVSAAPNFVHTLDAAHMLLLAREFPGEFAAVHDSFWTHAADCDHLARVTREQFALLHSRPLLQDVRDEWRARYTGRFLRCDVGQPYLDKVRWLRNGRNATRAVLYDELVAEYSNLRGEMPMKSTPWTLLRDHASEIVYKNGRPRLGKEGPGTCIWIPLEISDPPLSGNLNLAAVRNATHLFS